MKLLKTLLLCLFLAIGIQANSQSGVPLTLANPSYQLSFAYQPVGAGTYIMGPFNVTGLSYYTIQWVVSGTVTGCTVTLDGSVSNTGSFTTGSLMSSQTCNSSGSFTSSSPVVATRAQLSSTLSNTGTVKFTIEGFVTNPVITVAIGSNPVLGTPASVTGSLGLANGNSGGATATMDNTTYQTPFTFDIADKGYDVRGFGALLNGTGVSGVGHDDSAAVILCLAAYNDCIIPAPARGQTTHLRWATAQVIAPLTDGARHLHCVGANQQDQSGGTGTISIDVDLGGSSGGPALWLGSQNVSLQQGIVIDNSCRFRDISSSHNSPGSIGVLNESNVEIDSGATGFLLSPLGIPISPGSIASCTTTGGSISSAGSIFRQDEQLGPGWGSSLPSVEVSATSSSLGCTSGSSCSCTPTAPTLTAGAVADIVLLGTSSGGEHQIGMPYSCPSHNCGSMNTLFNYDLATTSATAVTSIPNTGNRPNAFDHSGGYGFLIMGTAGMNATNNGGVAASTTYSNQPKFSGVDCYNNNSCFDLEHNVAMAEIDKLHVRIQNGDFALQNEYNGEFNLVNFHIENIPVTGSGAGLNVSGAPNITNGLIESGNAATAINGVALSGAQFSNTACGASVSVCFVDDSASSANSLGISNIQGTITHQPSDVLMGNGALEAPAIKFSGSTSGSASIGVAAVAGTPTKLLLPITDGSSGQFLTAATPNNGKVQLTWSNLTFPITAAGTVPSGGVAYADSTTSVSVSPVLAANAIVRGGGAGVAPSTGNGDFTVDGVAHTLKAAAAGLVDFSAITSVSGFKIPASAGATSGANAAIIFDSTNLNNHVRTNSADSIMAVEAAALAANVIPKQTDATHGLLSASSMTDDGTQVLTTEIIKGGNTVRLTSDSSGITATTPGTAFLTFPTLKASTNYSFTCEGLYSQATAAVLDGFSVQAATNAATRWDAWGTMNTVDPTTGAITGSQASALNVTSTTSTPVVTGTPGAISTVYQFRISGSIQVGVSVPTVSVAAFTGNASDAVTIKAGTFCSVNP